MSLPTAKYRHLIYAISEDLPTWKELSYPSNIWLEAQILQESTGDPRAYRKESSGAESFGLMQLLTPTIKTILKNPTLSEFTFLYDPGVNLAIGRLVLLDIFGWVGAPDVATVLARYNGGGWKNPDEDGRLRNQDYVNRVAGWCQKVMMEK